MSKRSKKSKAAAVEVVVADETAAVMALNPDEKRDLKKCESIIRGGWETFLEVGKALATIQRQRLYREHHKTFDAYCRERWQYGKSHAHRLIGAAEVVDHLSPIGDELPLPLNESQVRPLIGLEAEDQVRAWKAAVQQAAGNGVTARLVRQAAAEFGGAQVRRPRKATRRKRQVAPAALEAVEAALAALAEKDLERTQAMLEKLRELLSQAA